MYMEETETNIRTMLYNQTVTPLYQLCTLIICVCVFGTKL